MNNYSKGTLPHAAYATGDQTAAHAMIDARIEAAGMQVVGNPDVIIHSVETFTVDMARELKQRAAYTPVGKELVCIVSFSFTTREAQNALLKLLEEPAAGVSIFLIVHDAHVLLPTVRSRLSYLGHFTANAHTDIATTFLTQSVAQRFETLTYIIEEKDKAAALAFLDALETTLHARGEVQTHAAAFDAILTAREGLASRAPAVKMLMEYIALTVPTLSK